MAAGGGWNVSEKYLLVISDFNLLVRLEYDVRMAEAVGLYRASAGDSAEPKIVRICRQ